MLKGMAEDLRSKIGKPFNAADYIGEMWWKKYNEQRTACSDTK